MVDPATASLALSLVQDVGAHALEVMERERTNRARIAAQAAIMVEEIRARRDVLAEAVREQAQVRRQALSSLADAIESAAKDHDVERLQMLIGAFTKVALDDSVQHIIEVDRQLRAGSFVLRLPGATES